MNRAPGSGSDIKMTTTPIWANENTYDKEFLTTGVQLGIPVSVLKGFAGMESGFNPKAYRAEVSINDASYGLMQILNRTAQGEGFTGSPDALYDPGTNIKYGASFLKKLLVRYPDLSAAVASYNMGSPRKAANTTATIIKIYGKPGPDWTYANQPYVDRVLSYIAYFQTFENQNLPKRAIIVDLIKKKITGAPEAMPLNPWYLSFPEVFRASPGI